MNHSPIGAHQSNSTAVNTTPTDDRRPSPLATGLNSLINTYVLHPLPDSANITQMLDAAWHYLVAHPGMRDQFEMEFSTLLDSHMESAPAGETDLTMSFLGQLSIMSSRQPMQNSAPARQVGETELRSALAEFDPALRAPDVNIHTLLDRARQDLSLNLSDSTPGGAATHRLLLKLEALLRKGDISKQVRQLLHEFLNPVISQGLNRLGKPPLVNIARMAFAFNFHETL